MTLGLVSVEWESVTLIKALLQVHGGKGGADSKQVSLCTLKPEMTRFFPAQQYRAFSWCYDLSGSHRKRNPAKYL